jgi:hypothetical protein
MSRPVLSDAEIGARVILALRAGHADFKNISAHIPASLTKIEDVLYELRKAGVVWFNRCDLTWTLPFHPSARALTREVADQVDAVIEVFRNSESCLHRAALAIHKAQELSDTSVRDRLVQWIHCQP